MNKSKKPMRRAFLIKFEPCRRTAFLGRSGKKMKNLLYITILNLGLLVALSADSPSPPVARVTTTDDGRHFFSMVPGKYRESDWELLENPYGVLFQPQDDGTFKELWRTRGWYADQVFLSYDARYLVRMGPWQTGEGPTKHHLALAFYDNGKLLKKHSVTKLIKDPKSVSRSVSHYDWRSDGDGFPHVKGYSFYLRTIEGDVICFSMTDGRRSTTEKYKNPNKAEMATPRKPSD